MRAHAATALNEREDHFLADAADMLAAALRAVLVLFLPPT